MIFKFKTYGKNRVWIQAQTLHETHQLDNQQMISALDFANQWH